VAGDTLDWRFQVRDESDAAVNLTGAVVTFRIFDTDASLTNLFTRTSVGGTEIALDAAQGSEVGNTGTGWFAVKFRPADLAALTLAIGRKFYQCVVTFGDGSVRTFLAGRVDVLRKH
jgi:hypothetical protein